VSRLSEIPIRIEPPARRETTPSERPGLGHGGFAILVELASLLERLASSNVSGAIDLHSMPMTDMDRRGLQDNLGRGEVRVFLDAGGVSEIQETAIPGIWWIQHRDQAGAITAELIEVAPVPEILIRARDEFAGGIAMLRGRIEHSAANRMTGPQYER
jgi:hydrogenase-1 operon protein HyaF